MKAAMKGRPSVVLPNVRTVTRGLAASSEVNQPTTSRQAGRRRSVPGAKPITEAGVGMRDRACWAGDVAGRAQASAARASDLDLNRCTVGRGEGDSEPAQALRFVAQAGEGEEGLLHLPGEGVAARLELAQRRALVLEHGEGARARLARLARAVATGAGDPLLEELQRRGREGAVETVQRRGERDDAVEELVGGRE